MWSEAALAGHCYKTASAATLNTCSNNCFSPSFSGTAWAGRWEKSTKGAPFFLLGQPLKNQPEFFLSDFLNNKATEGDELYFVPGNQVPKYLMANLALQASAKI